MTAPHIDIPTDRLEALCKRHRIKELSLFGSILREDFGPDSDIDVLFVFEQGHRPGLDDFLAMQDDFEALFGRSVDLVNKERLENPFMRHSILKTRKQIYAA